MKKGYILALSLKLLVIVLGVYLIRFNQIMTTYKLYKEADAIYERLEAENDLFEEILFRFYIYDDDDFAHIYEEYYFDVKMSETVVDIEVVDPEQYGIKLSYNDDCLCFSEILYK